MILIDDTKLIKIFCDLDDFCLQYQQWQRQKALSEGQLVSPAGRPSRLSESEILTLLVVYQLSGMKNFKYFYQKAKPALLSYFPGLVSYNRFVECIARQWPLLWLFGLYQCRHSERSGIYIIDSKKLPVCDIARIGSHKVFKHWASCGKSSTGWFYGLKLHLVINHKGEVVNFLLTSASKADNNHQVIKYLLSDLQGKCFGDKGYLTQLFEWFYQKGLHLVTKMRKNMKKLPYPLQDAILLRKRGLIESINDILMTVFDVEHTRHRKPENAIAHILASLVAYNYMEKKPSLEKAFTRMN